MYSGVFQLPNLPRICPKKTGNKISPGFQEAKDGYEQWVKENITLFLSIKLARFGVPLIALTELLAKFGVPLLALTEVLDKTEGPLLAALAWPKANSKELRAILDYMTMSIMLEELTDHCSSEEAKRICKLWINVLKDPQVGKGHYHPFIQLMTNQMVARLKDAVDPYHWPALMESNVTFSMNVIQEALDREASKDISATRCIASYMDMRRETIGTRPCIVLMRSTRRLYLPEDVLQHPILVDMENRALDMVYIANDIYSFKKEIDENGAVNNIINVIQKDPTTQHITDLQGRFDHAGNLFQAALNRFNACRDALPGFGDEETDRQVAAYGDGLVDWVSGNIEWSIVNQRYSVFRNDDDRQNHVLRLDDRWLISGRFSLLILLISVVITYILFR
ncbi:terpenoid synthase [Rhizopogon vinicolor AM-OR11-026]|uniref:Terpene synthase n=1 Tax=Rhizopogon vinicolor AM-OR11-026 TaxID=1314800 RepID=A0A1B7MRG1_9AGAM|nr:terpenoid synthase [Rhizopogon vinicolor AM-OR11-026]